MFCSINKIIDVVGWVVWEKNNHEKRVKGGAKPCHEGRIHYGKYYNHNIDTNAATVGGRCIENKKLPIDSPKN